MTPTEYLIVFHSEHCCRLKHGTCSTRRCLVRGGWKAGDVPSYTLATCEVYETVNALKEHEAGSALCKAALYFDNLASEFDLKYCEEGLDALYDACTAYRAALKKKGGVS